MTQTTESKDKKDHVLKCYVDQDGMAILRCPECGTSKTIDTNGKNYAFKTFKAHCRCGVSIRGQFEFRRYYRKKVRLAGIYKHLETGKEGNIIIENISLSGAGFYCFDKQGFEQGDQLDLIFRLDNPRRSEIIFRVEVQHIKNKSIGAKRLDVLAMQPELGFYLK